MRKKIVKSAKRVVIKIGSGVLTDVDGFLDNKIINKIASEISTLSKSGIEVVMVSSGAVAAGRAVLGFDTKPSAIPQKQAIAAIGQSLLMRAYQEAFDPFAIKTAQLLLTREDISNRRRFLNARAAISTLIGWGIIPIINENDTVAVDEIKFGDNDNLSALVTNVSEADLLMILTDVDALYTSDPRLNSDAKPISVVDDVTREIEKIAGGSGSKVGTGGMATKVAAAKKAAKNGAPTIMVPGKRENVIIDAMSGREIGTLFLAPKPELNRRKHWIAYSIKPKGLIVVDKGAKEALLKRGKSLLPSGIVAVEGKFERGGSVRIASEDKKEFARGIVDYSSVELSKLAGHKSEDIEKIIGFRYGDVAVHRDNMVLI